MKPPPFEYRAPDTLEEAIALLAEHGDDAKPLAGGQSLLPMLAFRLARPAFLVDLGRVPGLDGLEPTGDGGLRLGATTRQRTVERDPDAARRAPLLVEALPHVAHVQIRNRGTVGGSLAHADPAAELPAVALALEARLRIRGPDGDREVPAAGFFHGPFATDLAPDELLLEIRLPPLPDRAGWAFEEVARRRGDYALAAVAAAVSLDADGRCAAARIACVNLGATPVEAAEAGALLVGERPGEEAVRAAARAVAGEVDPPADIHASADYRRHLAGVLARRALARAFERARERPAAEAGGGGAADGGPGGDGGPTGGVAGDRR